MKNNIKLLDEVCFIYQKKLLQGSVISISSHKKKIYGIQIKNGLILYASEKYVAHIKDEFCIVQSEPNYSNYNKIRFDYTTYALRNKTYESWINSNNWIQEIFDPIELKYKSIVFGLEI